MRKFSFKIDGTDGYARASTLKTKYGIIKTPVFMPVGTIGSVKSIFQEELQRQKIDIILANTYHLMLRPGEDLIKELGGLHNFINWQKPILTDSGGFQVWSLSKMREVSDKGIQFSSHLDGKKYFLTPEKSIFIQEKLDSDISMVLDECTEYPASYTRAKQSMELSINWAKKCKAAFNRRQGYGLFGIIQGGMYNDLRKKCCEELIKINFDGYDVGGLSVGETHNQMIKVIKSVKNIIPKNKPRYLMGVGRPVDIINSVENGIDMFDCVLPTRFGRNGRAFTSSGEINLRNSKFKKDDTPLDYELKNDASRKYSKAYLHHLVKNNEILAAMIISLHNVAFYKKMMCDIRDAILNKKFNMLKKKYIKVHGKYKKT